MRPQLRNCLAELIGTFFLCFIGAGAICTDALSGGKAGLIGIAIAHGLALSIAVSATMNISGGHLNPAVTITMWVFKKIENRDAVLYIVSQLLGGVIAGLFLVIIFGKSADVARLGTPHVDYQSVVFQSAEGARLIPATLTAILIEAILTFLLVFAIFGTAVDPRAPKIGGFGIGLAIAADILVGGPLTGASMNPARTFGPGIWEAGIFGWERFRADHFIYWIGPIIGAISAGGIYLTFIIPEEAAKLEAAAQPKGKPAV